MTVGRRAEDIACAWLEARGLRLVERNYRCRSGELDLLMLEQRTLVVAEVRYRRSCAYGRPEETVDHRKQRRIVAATRHYLHTHPGISYDALRFDVVALSDRLEAPRIDWFQQAFSLG